MIRYSISDLENLTGIKAHTIRIWEKRYDTIKPSRTETNIRYYNDDDLKKLINISSLIHVGMKISDISKFSDNELIEEINARIGMSKSQDVIIEANINQLIQAALDFDEVSFDKLLSGMMLRMGVSTAYLKIVIPVLNRVGMLWTTDALTPVHEHFISNLIRQKFFSLIDAMPVQKSENDPVILFLPEFEDHEIGLLMANYLLRQTGRRTIYLGQRVPLENLKKVVEECNCSQLLFFLIQTRPVNFLQDYMELVSDIFRNIKLFVSGNKDLINQLTLPENMEFLNSPESVIERMKIKSE